MTMTQEAEYKYVGKPRRMEGGLEKVTGYANYVADLKLTNMVYGRPVFSPYAHANILSIDTEDAAALPGVVAVLTAEDLPTRERVINSRNSAILAKEKVYFVGQPVAIVVAESEAIAADAAELVFVDYEPLPAAIHLEEAILADAPTLWPNGVPQEGEDLSSLHASVEGGAEADPTQLNNVNNETHFVRGDVAAAFAAADAVATQTYRTNIVHQAYMESHACIVEPDPLGRGLTVYTSTQGQYSVRDQLATLLKLPASQIEVRAMTFGGGFGAKYGILEPLTAAVALTMRQPVRIVFSRSEDFLATTPAPATVIELKTAVSDGKLTALEARILIDNGAFSFGHGGIMGMLLGGYYKCDNVKIDAYDIFTNKAPVGAYRAPGAPQATFALEANIDEMVQQLGLDPLQFRLDNVVEDGDLMGNGRPWPNVGFKECLEALAEHPAWKERQLGANEGIGLAVGGWPTVVGTAEAVCRVDIDGTVTLEVGNTDVSGNNSSYVLIAAEVLGVTPDEVRVVNNNTGGAYGPGSGGSQVTYSVAGAVRDASDEAKGKLLQVASDEFEADPADIEIVEGMAQVRGVPDKQIAIGKLAAKARNMRGGVGPVVGEGNSALPENAPAVTAHLVKVHVDPDTGVVTPLDYVSTQDVGFAINPLMVEGQMHGGMIQGLGFGLHEAMVYNDEGQLLSGSFMDYGLPRIDQVPPLEAVIVNNPSPHGPFGARGIGEPPITAGAAALANAIKAATGKRLTTLPIKQEQIWLALQNGR